MPPPPLGDNPLRKPSSLPLVAPSILSADFANMEAACRAVLEGSDPAARGDFLHIDVMDGHFVPNLAIGPDMCRAIKRALPNAFLDVHLMVTDPGQIAPLFVEAGAGHITFHVEVLEPDGIAPLAEQIRSLNPGLSVGLAINPPTPVEKILPHIREAPIELLLVMSVNPGRSGQAFMPESLAKVREIKKHLLPNQRLEMDGGISPATAGACLKAGCDTLVAASAIFGQPRERWGTVIRSLRDPE